ncbi:PRK06851 family protein [Garciella nitratireducens]|uniref:KAP NTPase domain-containing protein n=1 Tax=Garciella nitratireducens DSM 15102 TaxID=1121911 RepID=A0A1T4KQ78_9FIRM|nr:PRK06851 family protein [Garciella nitratireducens]SJZ44589.1 hypothetical protein SAMN02745973_00655 [Garciella nitratireducens DSM 15102]
MTKNNMVKKVFPGGNTTKGFYSYYDYIIKEDANRIFILKGGPGVGKSSFMKKIENEMMKRRYFIEEHYCSSSNGSLDAIVIPDLQVALIDGTAPHIIDPKNPGAVDEIINLGEYWNLENMKLNKEEIVLVNKEVGRWFARAYKYLKALDAILQDISIIYQEGMNVLNYNRLEEKLMYELFQDKVFQNKVARDRHLFGSSITPDGVVDYLETIIQPMETIYYIKGNWGTGWSKLLDKVAKKAMVLGYDVEIYHTPFAPEKIADIVIPELNIAFTTNNKFSDQYTYKIDLDKLVNKDFLKDYQEELEFNKKMYQQLLNRSIYCINKAKLTHDKLESFYVTNMDFDKINEKRMEIIKRILKYEK